MIAIKSPTMRVNVSFICREITFQSTKATMATKPYNTEGSHGHRSFLSVHTIYF